MILKRHYLPPMVTEVTLCPLGDIQWIGEPGDVAFDSLQTHIAQCLQQPHPLFVGMGDYIDFASPSNREAIKAAGLYDNARTVIAKATRDLVDDVYERILKPTAGRWLGMVQGHHHFPLDDGVDSDEYLAQLLDSPWLAEFGLIKMRFADGYDITIGVFHGSGGSSVFPHGGLNKPFRFAPHVRLDLLLMGHTTKKAASEFSIMRFEAPEGGPDRLEHDECKLVNTGGWTKGYLDGKETYVSKAMLSPVVLGQPMIHIRPRFREGLWEPRITAEV